MWHMKKKFLYKCEAVGESETHFTVQVVNAATKFRIVLYYDKSLGENHEFMLGKEYEMSFEPSEAQKAKDSTGN